MSGWRQMMAEALAPADAPADSAPAAPAPTSQGGKWRARGAELRKAYPGLTEEWALAVAAVEQMPMPPDLEDGRWREIVEDARTFILRWHEHLGRWSVADVLGLDPEGGSESIGLAFQIRGGSALMLDDGEVVVRREINGLTVRTYFRPGTVPAETPPIWKIGRNKP